MAELEFVRVQSRFDRPKVDSIDQAIDDGIDGVALDLSGKRVAVLAGSRGIACVPEVLTAVVSALKSRGASPFVVPAMGSHGGATATGQVAVLADYGVTEERVGAPIRSSMETVELPSEGLETRLFADRIAWEESDFIVPVNRIKAHTDFVNTHESGLIKMLVIGLGKHDQAKAIHSHGLYGLKNLIVPAARRIIDTGRIAFGVAIVENAFEEPAVLEVISPEHIESRERELLAYAKTLSPELPVDKLDLLIIDELGKDKSGTGIDTNVIGRRYLPGEPEPDLPAVELIIVRSLTHGSHGNALGMGLADIVLKRFADAIDYQATYENIVTSSFLERGKLPIVADNDAEALRIALRALHVGDAASIRALHIRSTLELETFGATPAVVESLARGGGCEVTEEVYRYPGEPT